MTATDPLTPTDTSAGDWALDPEVAFLNHGSYGACPRQVLAHQQALRDRLERQPVLFFRELRELVDEARGIVGPFLGAAPEDIVPVPNATTGVNAVLRSLVLEPGDEILVTDHGYNACSNAVRFVCERAGASVAVAEIPFPLADVDDVVDAILAGVTERTRLALVDHITSPTGLVLPIERIVAALRERGVETLVDGAHALGMLPLELEAMGCAYYTGNAHKWMCAPKGAAVLYVRRDLQSSVRPVVISHGANADVPGRSRFLLECDWTGTDDPTAWLSIPAALEHLESLYPGGWSGLRSRNRTLALEARDRLCETLSIAPPAPDACIASLVSVPLPPAEERLTSAFDVDPLQTALWEEHRIEVPIMHWPTSPERVLRISVQAYNRPEEYAALCAALEARGL